MAKKPAQPDIIGTGIPEAWDPLEPGSEDPGMYLAAQRREIRNILKSYTGYYDLFAELIQNALDAVERRITTGENDYQAAVWIVIDLAHQSIRVTDNGTGMDLYQFKNFLRPNMSFKEGRISRGCKGVGATYLGYGFNRLEVTTKRDKQTLTGRLLGGREWVEDKTETKPRPKVEQCEIDDPDFKKLTSCTSMTVTLAGEDIRPKDLTWIGATTADLWLAILRVVSAIGGLYLCGEAAPAVKVVVMVVAPDGTETSATLAHPRYLYPHELFTKTVRLSEFLEDQARRADSGGDTSRIPPKYRNLNGIWGEWTIEDILSGANRCPINIRLDDAERESALQLGIRVYVFLAFSVEL
ncbi:MAG TPA: ATP-binding protein [Urbifossiella sp.]|nr:ATP-binding protein [Urbifossiella sp.]